MYEEFPWNKPGYKPKTRICDVFWHDFISAAKILLVLDNNISDEEKRIRDWQEPDVYAVFNKLRQDYFNELPYSPKFVAKYDKSIEREVARGRYPE